MKKTDVLFLVVLSLSFLLFPITMFSFISHNSTRVEAFALDSSGRLFIGRRSGNGNVVEVYDGPQLLYSFQNTTYRGYEMTIRNDELLVYTGRPDVDRLDLEGNVLGKVSSELLDMRDWSTHFVDAEGNVYRLKTTGRTAVIKNDSEIIFQQSKHDWAISLLYYISFPFMLILILSLLGLTGFLKFFRPSDKDRFKRVLNMK